jgi:hypothetical protein
LYFRNQRALNNDCINLESSINEDIFINCQIENKEEQTTQFPKEKAQKDKQRSTKHTYKTKDRVTRTPLKTGCELRCMHTNWRASSEMLR